MIAEAIELEFLQSEQNGAVATYTAISIAKRLVKEAKMSIKKQCTKLTTVQQQTIDSHMAYFHPTETTFSKKMQEAHMLAALTVFAKAYGNNGEPTAYLTTELRGYWFGRNKEGMYNFLSKYINL